MSFLNKTSSGPSGFSFGASAAPSTTLSTAATTTPAITSFQSGGFSFGGSTAANQQPTPISSTPQTQSVAQPQSFNLGGSDHGLSQRSSAQTPMGTELTPSMLEAVKQFQTKLAKVRTVRDECFTLIEQSTKDFSVDYMKSSRLALCKAEKQIAPLVINAEQLRQSTKSLRVDSIALLNTDFGDLTSGYAHDQLLVTQVRRIRERIEKCEQTLEGIERNLINRGEKAQSKDNSVQQQLQFLYKKLVNTAATLQPICARLSAIFGENDGFLASANHDITNPAE